MKAMRNLKGDYFSIIYSPDDNGWYAEKWFCDLDQTEDLVTKLCKTAEEAYQEAMKGKWIFK